MNWKVGLNSFMGSCGQDFDIFWPPIHLTWTIMDHPLHLVHVVFECPLMTKLHKSNLSKKPVKGNGAFQNAPFWTPMQTRVFETGIKVASEEVFSYLNYEKFHLPVLFTKIIFFLTWTFIIYLSCSQKVIFTKPLRGFVCLCVC